VYLERNLLQADDDSKSFPLTQTISHLYAAGGVTQGANEQQGQG
jgi:hypothetical protein